MAVSRENIKCVIKKVVYINCSITTKSGIKECSSFLHFLLVLYFHVFLCVHCHFLLLPSPHYTYSIYNLREIKFTI